MRWWSPTVCQPGHKSPAQASLVAQELKIIATLESGTLGARVGVVLVVRSYVKQNEAAR